MIRWWRQADYYKVALYMPFERMLDVHEGPKLVSRLAEVYRKAGFDVAPEEDVPCIWYQGVHKEWGRQERLTEYIPGYTKEQQEYLLKELEATMEEVKDDAELHELLTSYHAAVRDSTRIDIPAPAKKPEA